MFAPLPVCCPILGRRLLQFHFPNDLVVDEVVQVLLDDSLHEAPQSAVQDAVEHILVRISVEVRGLGGGEGKAFG